MRAWIVAAVVFAVAALGLAAAPYAIDWNDYRADLEAAAARLSGHNVTIRGPVDFKMFPRPILRAKDVTIASGEGGTVGFELAANQAEVVLEPGPLLAGRPVVRDLRLTRPVLSIDRESSLRLRAWPPRWQDWAAPFLQLDLERLSLSDGRVALTGERQGGPPDLRDLSLELQMNGAKGPLEAAGLFRTERHQFTIAATFGRPDSEGASAARLDIDARNRAEQTTSLRFSGRVFPFSDTLDLRGRLVFDGADLRYGLAALAAATGYPSTFGAIAAGQDFSIEGQIEGDRRGLRAPDLQLRLGDRLGKGMIDLQLHPGERLDLDLDLPPLRLADDAIFEDFLPLDLLSTLQMPPGSIDVLVREVIYRGDSARQAKVTLTTGQDRLTRIEQAKVLLPGLIDLRFDGGLYPARIGQRLTGRLAAVGDNAKSSLTWLGLLEERGDVTGWRGFSLEGDVDVTSVEMALRPFDLRLDASSVQGDASLRFSERRRLSLDIDVDRPNFDQYVGDEDAATIVAALEERLGSLDADVDLRLTRAIWQGVHIEEGMIRASAEGGQLTIGNLYAATVGDTALALAGTIDLDSHAAELDATLTSAYPARALHHLDLDLPLSSSRLRPLELSASMSGTPKGFDVTLAADYDGGDAAIEGRGGWIDDRAWYDLTVNARHPDHLALAGHFGLAPLLAEGDAAGPFELTGRLRRQTPNPWIASGNAKLGPTTFTGSLSYPEAPFEGQFDAKLSVGAPQKDSLAPFLILAGLRLAGDWTPERWLGRLPTAAIRTAWLDRIEGSLSLASKGGLVGEGLSLNATLNDGLLYVDRIEATPWNGSLKAEVTLERRNNRAFTALAFDLKQVEAADLAAWAGMKGGIEGPLDLRIEASSSGLTPYDLMAGLAGDIELELGPGTMRGLGIPALRRTLLGDEADQPSAGSTLNLPFRRIEAEAGLSRGIVAFERAQLLLDASEGKASVAGIEGTVDLLLWIADMTVSRGPPPSSSEEAAPAAEAQRNVYRVVGPPDRPDGFVSSGN